MSSKVSSTCNNRKSIGTHLGMEREGIRRKNRNEEQRFPGGHAVHLCAYGTTYFDESLFARRFARHNEEVRAYFKDRPEDLLVIDISQPEEDKARWNRLCEFIGYNGLIPSEQYPRSFSTKARLKQGLGRHSNKQN